ncbi:chemotaxis protein CheD [bacterium]|nr:chemotaxis protein CheD [bacterium]
MATLIVGVGECKVSNKNGDKIRALTLGSCVSVIAFDPKNHVAGILNIALPDSSINKKRVTEHPGMFANTGIPLLLRMMTKSGYDGKSELIIKLAGGSTILDSNQTFNIGKRNILAARKALHTVNLKPEAEDVSDNYSRTVSIDVVTGIVIVSSPGKGQWDL